MVIRWKWIILVVSGLVIGSLATLYVILSRYDFNHLKPEIAGMVKAATGRELTISGEIGLKVGFSPTLTMDNVSLRNAPWGSRPEMVHVSRLEVQVAMLPLVLGKIEVKRLVLVEPDILLETDQAGRLNLMSEELAKVSSPPRESESPGQDKTLPGLSFGEIEIEKGTVAYRDEQAGTAFTVAVEHLAAVSSAPEDVITLRGNGAANGTSFAISGTVGSLPALLERDRILPVKLSALVAGVTVSVEGEMRDALRTGDYTFNLEASGPSAADLIRLVKGGSGPELGPFKVLAKLVGQKKNVSIERFDIEVGLEELVAWKFTGHVKNPLAQRGAEVTFRVFGKDLALVGGLARRPIPIEGPFAVSGHVSDVTEKVYQLSELKVATGENDLTGSLQLDFRADRPGITGTLSSNKLDLRPFIAREKDGKSPAGTSTGAASSGRIFPTDPLSLDWLKKVNAKIQIDARQILTPRLAINNLLVTLVLDEGALTLNPLKAALGGGTLNGHIALQSREKAVDVEAVVKANRVDVDLVARELGLAERPGGKLDFDCDIRGAGGSVAEIMAGLNGKTLLVMSKGRINNKYLDLLGADVSRSLLRLFNPFSHEISHVEINCFVSGFEIRGGMAQSTALVMDTNHMTVVGEGKINLKTEELDLTFKPTPKEGLGISGVGKISLGLGELAQPFKLGGTLARPTMVFDVTQAVVSFGKTVGGAVLFGPAAIAAFLGGGSPSEENACLAAVEASKKGVKPPGGKIEQIEDAARKAVDGVGDTLKKMFRK